jgi:hypothetical protein
MSSLASQSQSAPDTSYKIRNSEPMKDVSIQIVSFGAVSGLDKRAIKKINTAMTAASATFEKEAKECSTYAQGHPWGDELNLEKVLLSEKYLSVVFAKSTVCAGSPDLKKEAHVFSVPTGDLVPARVLFKQMFPAAKLISSTSPNKELIRLDEEMAETLINGSKEVFKTYDSECEFYLKHAAYRIWTDGKNLILFPEFIQPESSCQKEYLIQPEG